MNPIEQAIEALEELVEYAETAGFDWSLDNARAALSALRGVEQQPVPYGQVTVVRRPGCVDQHWFYRWPEPPYLDNAAECHTVYATPPTAPVLTEAEIVEIRKKSGDIRNTAPWADSILFARAIESEVLRRGGGA